ncbi:ComEC/Rec2 family competence protein [Shimia ponticola]|uniref:ComEC/Rec2 family competence protein n=1 Tax=Shimia ponticola TaxID=2582893 RepID=UPI00321193F2
MPLVAALQRQRGQLLHFVPVCMAVGIGVFFALPTEPGFWVLSGATLGGLILIVFAVLARHGWGPVWGALACVALGFVLAGARAHWVATPVLEYRYYGSVEGRVVGIDRSSSDKVRLTLDRVRLERMIPARTPDRVRVTLHGQDEIPLPIPGATVVMAAHIGPAPGPAEPGGFEFARHIWFKNIGAVGYTRTPALVFAAPEPGIGVVVFRLRMAISQRLQAAMPGDTGAVAAAIVVGDRSAMRLDVVEALRQSNLAHLLAISGLHMGLLTGFVFGAVRSGLALIPFLALRMSSKKLAAGAALGAGAVYLALSGGSVATERAFVMVAVALGAVLFDRRALTLRAVAVAAIIVLALQPEALMSPGFQMSFAATTALVVAFRRLAGRARIGPTWTRPAVSVFLSSLIAGCATAPLAAAHFNIVSHFGLIANLVTVPLMGALIMPAAVVAALLWPLGLSWVPFLVMDKGLAWIIAVAQTVSDWPGAVGRVQAPPPEVLPILAMGAVFVVIWQGRERWLGAVLCLIAGVLWVNHERPPLLIASSGGLAGMLTDSGRVLNTARGDGFAARVWLENDGDASVQEEAARHGGQAFEIGDTRFIVVRGVAARDVTCGKDDVLVTNIALDHWPGCPLWDPEHLRQTGAIAVQERAGALHITTARSHTGRRIWNDPQARKEKAAQAARLWALIAGSN